MDEPVLEKSTVRAAWAGDIKRLAASHVLDNRMVQRKCGLV
jgi:hypothetical protein